MTARVGIGKTVMDVVVGASQADLFDALRERDLLHELNGMTRTQWAEARHTIRYVAEDLKALHTRLETAGPGWEADLALELARAEGRLAALQRYITGTKAAETCAACGKPAQGYARGRNRERLCHTDERRCYRDYVQNNYTLPRRHR